MSDMRHYADHDPPHVRKVGAVVGACLVVAIVWEAEGFHAHPFLGGGGGPRGGGAGEDAPFGYGAHLGEACVRNATTACGRALNLDAAMVGGGDACMACVWETCSEVFGSSGGLRRGATSRECLPIEPLRREEWRHDARGGDHSHKLTGDAEDLRTGGQLAAMMTNKLALINRPGARLKRRKVYVDLGANMYESSVGNWFRKSRGPRRPAGSPAAPARPPDST